MKREHRTPTNEAITPWLAVLAAVLLAAGSLSPPATAQVAVSEDNITIMGDDVLTMGHATPLYARGTGLNNPANRVVKFGDMVVVNDPCDFAAGGLHRGLTLSLFDANGYVGSSNYDTWGSGVESEALADVLETLGNGEIGVLTSCDAFEALITPRLREQARRLGLVRLATIQQSFEAATWQHPYAAIFHGASLPTANHQAVEILQPNAASAPHAILATWLMDDGFVGQAQPEARPDPPCFDGGYRFVDCGNGTVTDTATGLIYLKEANCFGQQDWRTANESAAGLASGQCGLSDNSRPGDWRLQTKEEWEAILDSSCTTEPRIVGNGSPQSGCYWANEWASGVVLYVFYWSSTTHSSDTRFAWIVSLTDGTVSGGAGKDNNNYVWPVRGGQ